MDKKLNKETLKLRGSTLGHGSEGDVVEIDNMRPCYASERTTISQRD